ncbi:MAG: hypothetical protein HCAMLNBO_00789 [Candidatus Brocadia fulgida]|nr:hypothetical protein [Candidatus Brocadia fulgida]
MPFRQLWQIHSVCNEYLCGSCLIEQGSVYIIDVKKFQDLLQSSFTCLDGYRAMLRRRRKGVMPSFNGTIGIGVDIQRDCHIEGFINLCHFH